MLLFYIRHGDPIYSPDSLTPLGHRQAEALAKRLAMYGIDRVYASSSERAKLTAKPTCELTKHEAEILDWANEGYAWRDLTVPADNGNGHTWAFASAKYRKLFNDPSVRALGRRWYTHPAFEGTRFAEGIERVQTEADNWLASLGYRHDLENSVYIPEKPNDERVALFAHQGFGLAFLSCVLDVPYPIFCTHFDLTHSSMTVIDFQMCGDVTIPRALEVSNDSHLYREGLPTRYNGWLPF